ncbi:MAG: DUF2007 domain-containing protein [Bacteroidales bacterium]|nr:DUF2007 domain-containing protein [Bacteroidales bacterium]
MEKNWVSIFSTEKAYLADIARLVLDENNISSIILNRKDSSYQMLGEIELYVNRDEALRAKNLLKSIESERTY